MRNRHHWRSSSTNPPNLGDTWVNLEQLSTNISDYESRLKVFRRFVTALTADDHSGNSFIHGCLLCFHERFSCSLGDWNSLELLELFQKNFFLYGIHNIQKICFFSLFLLKTHCDFKLLSFVYVINAKFMTELPAVSKKNSHTFW